MRLRTKLLGGILLTLLAQIAVTGTFTLVSFLSNTRNAREADLRADWDRARSFVEELRHRLSMDMYQLAFLLKQEGGAAATTAATTEAPAAALDNMAPAAPAADLAAAAPAVDVSAPPSPAVVRLQETVRYFISLTSADRIVIQDDPGGIVVDEKAGVSGAGTDLPIARINPADFQFPRSEFVPVKYGDGTTRLFLVTGTTFPSGEGSRRLYLVTDIDKGMAESIWEKTGTEVAFFVGATPVAAASAWETFETESPPRSRIVRLGADPYSVFSQTLAADPPARVNMAAVRSLLAERLYVRSVLFSYLTAFLVTLAGSLFVAAGITSLVVSPFSRLSAWLHRYMDTGVVQALQIRTRDETGFLAGAFHGMVSTLIEEKRVIGEQLEQIRFLHAWNERIVDGIRAGIVVTDSRGDVEFCNSYFAGLVGREPAALRGMPLRALVERAFDLRGGSAEVLSSAENGGRDGVLEGLSLRRDGEPEQHFTAKVSGIALAGSRQGSLVVLEDVSASEHLWERMTIADRITSLGILSAGMAHEINNPLGSILSHVSWLKAVETEKDKLHSLTWIESETNRIAALIRRIRAWSAPAAGPDAADLNAVCVETLEVLRFTLEKRRLVLSLDLCPDLPPVACGADELKQVVLNILLNAEEACGDGGSVTVRTSAEEAGMVALRVVDDGAGIAAEHVHRVFDPFFTTKGSRNGNGLGLSICYAIVKRAGGDIRVASTPGRGTEVEVMLRVHERPDSG